MNFPDLPHLRHLQKDLWQWPKSQAPAITLWRDSCSRDPLPEIRRAFDFWDQIK